jgi:hypothetical protein
MKDTTTTEPAGPLEPPVPPALLELFGDAEAQTVRAQGEPAPLPAGPSAAELRERSRREQLLMAWARANGCPRHLLAKGSWAVENCRGWYREFGSWPIREEFLTASGVDGKGGFTRWDRPAGEPNRRKVAVYRDGRWDNEAAANVPAVASIAAARQPATRARGAGRPKASATRSSARSGDSGSEDGESEPSPARECAWCGTAIDHLNRDAEYCGAKHRVYAQRERDRQRPERVAERAVENGDSGRAKPCRCWPSHNLIDSGVCVKCGRGVPSVAWWFSAPDVRSKQLVARAPARRNPRYGDRKRKPVREFVDREAVAA